MSPKARTDSVDWMRGQWEAQGEPGAPQFTAMVSLLRTTVVVSAEVDRVLKKSKLTRTAYLVMVTLHMSPDGVRPLGQLSKVLLVHPTTVTMVVDQLEETGLVVRKPHPSDRRTVLACLTEKGTEAVKEASSALSEMDYGFKGTGDQEADDLTDTLRRVREGLGDLG
ncbi:MarR family transcriptional regulator [Streptomyces albus]|uniref:MarR family transcriptional regulator n=1 Tax=Streptomyces albus (strain ATCC 21838 / DSM 41398 / FERM P-419 / JCM 4703 / NBRC 107858) TaxID=1081613 RepID=A0A0B5F6S1_STRA4|nr:MarR family transcriptional regulator [Streptomyces albus]AYN37271.1 MarR family transcriptional regulator [Streptomyces albus]